MFKMARINPNLKPHLISILISALQVRVLSEEKHGNKLKLKKKKFLWFLLESAGLILFLTKELSYTKASFQTSSCSIQKRSVPKKTQSSPSLSLWWRNIVVYMSLSRITTFTPLGAQTDPRGKCEGERERERDIERESVCVCLQSVASLRGPEIRKKQDVCVCLCKHMFIRKCRRRQCPPPQCFRWWRRWRSRARWHRWTWTVTHPAGRVPKRPRQRRGRWPRS